MLKWKKKQKKSRGEKIISFNFFFRSEAADVLHIIHGGFYRALAESNKNKSSNNNQVKLLLFLRYIHTFII